MLRISTAVCRARFQNVARRHRAVHAGQREVHHHHRRAAARDGRFHGLMAVAGLAHHANFGVVLQHAAEAAAHQAVIVHQQHRNNRHEKSAAWPQPAPILCYCYSARWPFTRRLKAMVNMYLGMVASVTLGLAGVGFTST